VGVALLNALLLATQAVDLLPRAEAAAGEGRLPRIVLEDAEGERHGGGVAPGEVGEAGGVALVLPEPLGLPVGEVDDPVASRSPAVIHGLIGRQPPARVIAIVRHLVIELGGGGMEAEHPLEAPARLVQHVGETVRAGLAEAVHAVAEGAGSDGGGQQELGGGVARGEQVLEQVPGVVPAPAGVQIAPLGTGPIGGAAVEGVAHGVEPGVVSATLLPEVFEERVRQVGRVAHGKGA